MRRLFITGARGVFFFSIGFSFISISDTSFSNSTCTLFLPFFSNLESFPATKLYKDWLVFTVILVFTVYFNPW